MTKKQRSYCMSRIQGKNTKPEMQLRKLLWSEGIRGYRLHTRLPGKPDIYFPKRKIAVFIDGCFWHHCPQCFVKPKTNIKFWNNKIYRNKVRDAEVDKMLNRRKIQVLRFWEHAVCNNPDKCLLQISTIFRKQSYNEST